MTRSPFLSAWLAGLLLVSTGSAQALEAPAVERPAPDRIEIRWQGPDPVDVYLASSPDAPLQASRQVAKGDDAGTLSVPWTEPGRPYVTLKDDKDGALVRTAERALPLERGSNFRDLGGYPAADGKHVRWGLIYRTGATPMLTDADFRYVAGLHIASDIDLRSIEERQLAPDQVPERAGARYFATDYSAAELFSRLPGKPDPNAASPYRAWLVSLAPQYRAIFQRLLRGEGAVAFHCSAGQDRSGVAAALVLSALGVPRDVIYADYHLSTKDRRPEYEMPPIDPARYPNNPVAAYFAKAQANGPHPARPLYDTSGAPLLKQTFDEIDTRWGSVETYLDQVLGVSAADIARLRAMYLE
jgi:protein-tyrosine phosphatase